MVHCNIRKLSYVSAGINLILLLSMAITMIVLMVMHQDKNRKDENEKSGLSSIGFNRILYMFIASTGGFFCTFLLLQGIRLDRHKFIYYYIWSMGLLLVVWCVISLHLLFNNIGLKRPIGTIILQFGLCVLFVVFECILFVPVSKVYKEIKNKPYTSPEMHSLNRH